MITSILITEDELDAKLMEALLSSKSLKNVKCISAGGWSSADSLARSYLTDRDTRVAIIVDADSLDENTAEERKRFLKRSLGQIAESDRWRVVVIKPEVEALLFEDQEIIKGLIGTRPSANDFTRGSFEPKEALKGLLGNKPISKVYERLNLIDLSPIFDKNLDIKELIDFFQVKQRVAA